MNYLLHLCVMIGIYLPVAYSLNLTVGFAGLIPLCHAVFYGVGAYAYALIVTSTHVSPLIALPAAVLITVAVAWGIGAFAVRFRGDLFLFVTLAFQMIVFAVLSNWIQVTNGPYGISDIPRPQLFGYMIRTPMQYATAVVAMNIVLLPLLFALYRSPFGLMLKALREDETAAEALGIEPARLYLWALILSAAFASVSGAFYAAYVTYIDPSSFSLGESIFQVAIVLLGGSGNLRGPFIGVVLLLLIPEALRFVGMPDAYAHNARGIIYGLLLAVMMYARPQGIAGESKAT